MGKSLTLTAASLVALTAMVTTASADPVTANQASTVVAMNSDGSSVPQAGERALTQDNAPAQSGVLVETFSTTASCVNGMNKWHKKVCRHTLAAPEGMLAVPGSITVDGAGYSPEYTQIRGNEIEFVITNRTMGKKTVTVSADFKYAPEELNRTVLTQLQGE